MRTSPPQPYRLFHTISAQLTLCGLTLCCLSALAGVHDDVERLIRNGQLERAQQLSMSHLQKSPQDPQMRLLQSRILDAQGQLGAAQELLESLTLEFPELPEPHNNLAVLYARQGRTQDALDSLNKALLARPDYAVALENLGDLHLSQALQAYQRASHSPAAAPSALRKANAIAPLLTR